MYLELYTIYIELFGDDELNRFSVDQRNQNTPYNETDFKLCSDRFVALYPTYLIDDKGRVTPGPQTPTHNFN